MFRDCRDWVNACAPCQRRKATRPQNAGLTTPITADKPFEHVAIDTVGPFYDENGKSWKILTMVDSFTRWPIAIPITDETTETVAEALYTHLITKHGVPVSLASDRANGFTSAAMRDICNRLGVRKKNTSGLQPQANSTCERFHRFLNASISIMCNKYGTNWHKYVDATLFAYRTTVNASTGFSPFFMMYGRHPRLPLDVTLGIDPGPNMPKQTSVDFVTRMAKVYETARARQTRIQTYNKTRRDATRHHAVFEKDDPILVWEPPKALNKEETSIFSGKIPKKLQHRWSTQTWFINAPAPVSRRDDKPATLYTIKNSEGEVRDTPVNVNRLRHFYPWADEMPTTDYESPELVAETETPEPFTKSPGVNVKVGSFVLIPTDVNHVLPYIVGEVTETKKQAPVNQCPPVREQQPINQ